MPEFKAEYGVTVPKTLSEILSLFEGQSVVWNILALLTAGLGWLSGYVIFDGGGTLSALGAGGAICGIILGIAFTRGLGGPALNLIMSMVWPFLFGGGVGLAGDIPLERLYDLDVGIALTFPAFFTTFGCMLAWFTILGPDQINQWSQRNLPPAFLKDPNNKT